MEIVLPGDLDVFFDAEGFGEAITFRTPGSAAIPAIALWDRADARPRFGGAEVALSTNHFTTRHDVTGEPIAGDTISIDATGETFVVDGVAERSIDGVSWRCAAVPA